MLLDPYLFGYMIMLMASFNKFCVPVLTGGFLMCETLSLPVRKLCSLLLGTHIFWLCKVGGEEKREVFHLTYSENIRSSLVCSLTPAYTEGQSPYGGTEVPGLSPKSQLPCHLRECTQGREIVPPGEHFLHFVSALSSLEKGESSPGLCPKEKKKFHYFLFHSLSPFQGVICKIQHFLKEVKTLALGLARELLPGKTAWREQIFSSI